MLKKYVSCLDAGFVTHVTNMAALRHQDGGMTSSGRPGDPRVSIYSLLG